MEKTKKSKLIKTTILLISTLLLPIQLFGIVFYCIPSLYIGIVVPYLIWKIWFGEDKQKIKKINMIWKIPVIILLAADLIVVEMMIFSPLVFISSLLGKIIAGIFLVLLLRAVTYASMIFIWQPNILKPYRNLIYAFILSYIMFMADFMYLSQNAPDTDDYSIPFHEYMNQL